MAKEMNKEALNASLRMIDKYGERNIELLRQQDAAAAEKMEKVGELLKDEAFIAAFLAADSAEEAAALFVGRGVEMGAEETTQLAKQIVSLSNKLLENDGELTEEELEQIAGGWNWAAFGVGLAGGAAVGAMFGSMVGPVGTAVGAVVTGVVVGVLSGLEQELGRFGKWLRSLF